MRGRAHRLGSPDFVQNFVAAEGPASLIIADLEKVKWCLTHPSTSDSSNCVNILVWTISTAMFLPKLWPLVLTMLQVDTADVKAIQYDSAE